MSEFTAEEYRTAAKVLRTSWNQGGFPYSAENAGEYCAEEAARLEAESARDEEAERLARVYWEQYTAGDTERDRYRFDRLCDDTQRVVKAGIRAVLEKVQMDAEWLIAEAVWETRIAYGEWPTEPVESAREGEVEKLAEDLAFAYCIGFGHDADEFKWNTGGRGHDAWMAVARQVLVLAADGLLLPEGGTVLDEFELDGIRELVDAATGFKDLEMYLASVKGMLDGIEDARRLRTTPPAVSVPGSGPDGTPEKPWPTWDAVPNDTPFWSRDQRETNSWWWIKRGGELRQADSCGETIHLGPTSFMNHFAPLVRVDGDQA
ncbi:hypothetical protein [Promicromonospora sukumoe]